jgi:hypothetical protein
MCAAWGADRKDAVLHSTIDVKCSATTANTLNEISSFNLIKLTPLIWRHQMIELLLAVPFAA